MSSIPSVSGIPPFVSTRNRPTESVKPTPFPNTATTTPTGSPPTERPGEAGDQLLGRLRQQVIESADKTDSHVRAERHREAAPETSRGRK
jgi:hypothetical protein